MKSKYLFLVFGLIIFGCSSNGKIEEYTSRDIVIVTIQLDRRVEIRKIELVYENDTISLTHEEIGQKEEVKLKFPLGGEGIFEVCVETTTGKVCSNEVYVEGGYRPKIEFKNNAFKFVRHF